MSTIYYRFQCRGGTAANLAAVNEIPLARELVFETDTGKSKLGDGVTHWNSLAYVSGGGGGGGGIAEAPNDAFAYARHALGWLALDDVAVTGDYFDLINRPSLATVATSGAYADLSGKPTFLPKRVYKNTAATGTVAINWANYDEARLTLTGDVSLTFSGATDGQGCVVKLKQDGTGNHNVTLASGTRFSADVPGYSPTLSAGAIDRIGFLYDGDDAAYDFVSLIRNIA